MNGWIELIVTRNEQLSETFREGNLTYCNVIVPLGEVLPGFFAAGVLNGNTISEADMTHYAELTPLQKNCVLP